MAVKLLADENVPESIVSRLYKTGLDITSVGREDLKGIGDDEVMEKAIDENRVLLTIDKDFVSGLEDRFKHKGIIKFRDRYRVGKMIKDVQKAVSTLSEEEFENAVIYLPWKHD